MKIRIVFFGSPDFALPALGALYQHFSIIGVVTQPDKPAGRGRILTAPPVKQLAERYGIPVIQPARLREAVFLETLLSWKPDLLVVAAYGKILSKYILDIPKDGCLNIHPSLLPRWRGASPIPFTLLAGDTISGVTILQMDAGMDSGPIVNQEIVTIYPEENAQNLNDRLSVLGAKLLVETIPDYISGKSKPVPQDESLATYSRLINKQDGLLDFAKPGIELVNQVRAFTPLPGAYLLWKDAPLKIIKAHVHTETADRKIGARGLVEGLPAIGTQDGWLVFEILQPSGKKMMTGAEFLRGVRDWK